MTWRDAVQKLSHGQVREIASLCAGATFLIALALILSGTSTLSTQSPRLALTNGSQAAATALGDIQGIPPGYTGKQYPADPTCYINRSYYGYGPNWTPICTSMGTTSGSGGGSGGGFGTGGTPATYGPIGNGPSWGGQPGDTDNFSTGIFSVDLGGGTGQSVYAMRTYTMGGAVTQDLGPATPSCSPLVTDDSGQIWCGVPTEGGLGSNGNQPTYSCDYASPAGYGPVYSQGTECYADEPIAPSFSAPTNTTKGTAPTVYVGQNMNFEWSCLPSRAVLWEAKSGQGTFSQGGWGASYIYNIALASSVTGSGPAFSPASLTGTQTVTAPTTPGTYTYSLTCNGGTNAMPITVNVINAAPPPTLPTPTISMTANGKYPPDPVVAGTKVTIKATFTAGSVTQGDALYVGTVVNCNQGVVSTNVNHLNCATAPIGYSTPTPGGTALYLGSVANCNQGIVSNNSNLDGCATVPIGYSSPTPSGSALYVGTVANCNQGVVSTNSNHLGCATTPIGYTLASNVAGDTLLKTAINDFADNLWCGTGCTPNSVTMWPPQSGTSDTKSYVFDTTGLAPGSYKFSPAVQTASYPGWNDYGKSLTLVVTSAACPNGANNPPDCNQCTLPLVWDTSSSSCIPSLACTPAWLCTSWSTCVAGSQTCTTATDTNSCGVATGNPVGSTRGCVVPPPTITAFSANPNRVRANTPSSVSFTYTVTNPPAGGCTIAGPGGFSLHVSPASGVQSSTPGTVTISQTSFFTLTCGSVSVQSTIGLIPSVIEL